MRAVQIGHVVIADSHPLELLGMAAVIKSVFHCQKLDFATGLAELRQLLARSPELALIDLELPGILSPTEIQHLGADFPSTRFVVVASGCSPQTILNILGCGVYGFIPKTLSQGEMVAALRQIAAGSVYVPHLACQVPTYTNGHAHEVEERASPQLSVRQKQVLQLASEGRSNKEIARKLQISEATVKVHISAAFKAMGVHNRVRAIALFQQSQERQAVLPLDLLASAPEKRIRG